METCCQIDATLQLMAGCFVHVNKHYRKKKRKNTSLQEKQITEVDIITVMHKHCLQKVGVQGVVKNKKINKKCMWKNATFWVIGQNVSYFIFCTIKHILFNYNSTDNLYNYDEFSN